MPQSPRGGSGCLRCDLPNTVPKGQGPRCAQPARPRSCADSVGHRAPEGTDPVREPVMRSEGHAPPGPLQHHLAHQRSSRPPTTSPWTESGISWGTHAGAGGGRAHQAAQPGRRAAALALRHHGVAGDRGVPRSVRAKSPSCPRGHPRERVLNHRPRLLEPQSPVHFTLIFTVLLTAAARTSSPAHQTRYL